MKKFHRTGTFWTDLKNIIETPLFVDSELTSMVQLADLCAFALRRYLENQEEELFSIIYKREIEIEGVDVLASDITMGKTLVLVSSVVIIRNKM